MATFGLIKSAVCELPGQLQEAPLAETVNSHRLKAVARVTGCKPSFRPKAGRMGPAPSGLQEVDGLNHLLGNLHPDRYFDQLYTSQSPRPSHCPNCSRSSSPQISRIKSRTRTATSPLNAGRRYLVIQTRCKWISNTVCAPRRYSGMPQA